MKKIILSLVGVVGLTTGSWGQIWEPTQNFNFPDIGLTTPSGSYDPSQVTYTLDRLQHDANDPSVYRTVDYVGSDGSKFTLSYNTGNTPKHRIWFFGPNNQFAVALNSASSENISDPFSVSYDQLGVIPWLPHLGQGISIANPLTPEVWASVQLGPLAGGGTSTPTTESIPPSPQAIQTTDGLILQTGEFHVLP